MSQPETLDHDPLGPILESYLEQYRQGVRLTPEEYAARYPLMADRIRRLLPALLLVEAMGTDVGGDGPSRLPTMPTIPPLTQVADYRIVREIGRGGMGVVYEAEQVALHRYVALKVLSPRGAITPIALQRFRQEARAAAKLHHAHIVPVFDVGHFEGVYYYAMQLIPGHGLDTLRARIPGPQGTCDVAPISTARYVETGVESAPTDMNSTMASGPFRDSCVPVASHRAPSGIASPVFHKPGSREYYAQLARIAAQAAEALCYAHDQGVLHRDVKPSNLILDAREHLWITDFGLAKAIDADAVEDRSGLTQTGDVVGTIRYMAPERFRGWSDPRSDIYALGMTLYELATLRPAFDARDRLALIHQVAHQRPIAPRAVDRRIPRDFETIILKAIDKEPSRRYQSAGELFTDLQNYLEDRPLLARPASAGEHAIRYFQRNPIIAVLSGSLLGILVTALVVLLVLWRQAATQRILAESNLSLAWSNLEDAQRAVDDFCSTVTNDQRMELPDLRPLRKDLLKKAVTFHEALLQRHEATAGNPWELVRAYHKLARLTAEIDEPDRAIEYYRQALAASDDGEPSPSTTERACEFSEMTGELARLLIDQAQVREAEHCLDLGIRRMTSYVQSPKSDHRLRAPLARLLAIKAYALTHTRRSSEAELLLRQAIEILDVVRAKEPESGQHVIDLAHTHWRLSDTILLEGITRWSEAEEELHQSEQLLQGAEFGPDLRGDARALQAAILRSQGQIELISGRPEEATRSLTEAIAILQQRCREEPSVIRHTAELGMTYSVMARNLSQMNDPRQRLDVLRKAKRALERVVKQTPGNALYEVRLAEVLENLGGQALRDGRVVAALAEFDRAIQIHENVLSREPENLNANRFLPGVLIDRAKALAKVERYAEALADGDRAIAMAAADVRGSYELDRARIRCLAGDYARAVDEVREVLDRMSEKCDLPFLAIPYSLGAGVCSRAAGLAQADARQSQDVRDRLFQEYAAASIAMLRTAIDAGLTDLPRLRDAPEFAAIRDVPDFVALMPASGP